MGIENHPEIKIGSDPENKPVKKRNPFQKIAGIALAAGILTLGTSDTAFAKKRVGSKSAETYKNRVLENNPHEVQVYQKKIKYLENYYSDYLFDKLSIADQQAHKAKNKIAARPKIRNFEELGIDPKYMLKIFSEEEGCYPAGSINKNIAEVTYRNKVYKAQPHYGMPDKYVAGGIESLEKDNIIFFRSPHDPKYKGKDPEDSARIRLIISKFSHEVGHINQGTFSNFMLPEQKIDFFFDVSCAISDSKILNSDAFQDYIGKIRNKNRNEKNYLVTTEYWAMLCECYLNEPEKFDSWATDAEQKLIKKWLLREKGQNFDPKAARDKRYYLTEQVVADQIAKANQRMQKKARLAAPKKHLQGKKPTSSGRRY
jgi:hypothetical protein